MSVEAIDKESIKILEELFRRAERRILYYMSQPGTFPDNRSINAMTALTARRRISETLDGLAIEAESMLNEGAVEVFRTVIKDNIAALPADFTTDSAQAVSDVFKNSIKEIPDIFGRAKADIRKGIISSIILGTSLTDTIDTVSKKMKISLNQAEVLTSTTLLSTEAASSVVLAEETGVPMVYIYSGPNDGKTRSFCHFYGFQQGVNVAYTRDAMRELSKDPNQKKQPGGKTNDTAYFRGGYNCRHTWAPRPRQIAEDDGYKILDVEDVRALIAKGGSLR